MMSTLNLKAGIEVLKSSTGFVPRNDDHGARIINQIIKALNTPKTDFLPVTEFMIKYKFGVLAMEYQNHPENRFETFKSFLTEMVKEYSTTQVVYSEITHIMNEISNDFSEEEYSQLQKIHRGY